MKHTNDLLARSRPLAHIKPPERSFADWHRFLDECREEGVSDVYLTKDGDFAGFVTPFGFALLKRWRWLRDAEKRGLTYQDAETQFRASFERERDAVDSSERERMDDVWKAVNELKDERDHGLRIPKR